MDVLATRERILALPPEMQTEVLSYLPAEQLDRIRSRSALFSFRSHAWEALAWKTGFKTAQQFKAFIRDAQTHGGKTFEHVLFCLTTLLNKPAHQRTPNDLMEAGILLWIPGRGYSKVQPPLLERYEHWHKAGMHSKQYNWIARNDKHLRACLRWVPPIRDELPGAPNSPDEPNLLRYAMEHENPAVTQDILNDKQLNLDNSPLICKKNNRLQEAVKAGDRLTVINLITSDPLEKHGLEAAELLRDACQAGHLSIVNLLLNDADPNANIYPSPLYIACKHNRLEIVEVLLSKQANPNKQNERGLTPLHVACRYNRVEIVGILLANQADPNIQNERGYTPLYWAIIKRRLTDAFTEFNPDIAVRLLNSGALAKPGWRERYSQKTLFHYAAACYGDQQANALEVIKSLIKQQKEDIDLRDPYRQTALHLAARKRNGQIVQRLLAAGANLWAADKWGFTPLEKMPFAMQLMVLAQKTYQSFKQAAQWLFISGPHALAQKIHQLLIHLATSLRQTQADSNTSQELPLLDRENGSLQANWA